MKVQNTSATEGSGIKIVVAGEAGNGKTTLARTLQDTLGEPVLLISAEAGLLSLKGTGVDYVDLQTDDDGNLIPKEQRVARLGAIYNWLLEPATREKYRWVFIDSLTEVNQNLLEALEANPEFNSPKDTIKKYGELAKRMRSLCKTFRDMPHYNVVFSALVKKAADADNIMKSAIDITGSFALQLPALFDEVFYLGVTDEVGEDGRNRRTILTQKTDKIEFPKDRSGKLDRYEPADLGLLVKKMRAAAKPKGEPIAAAAAPTSDATPVSKAAEPLVADVSASAKEASKKTKAEKAATAVH